jgi:hypothetical protein
VPHRPFDGRRIGLSANCVKFGGKLEAIPKDVAPKQSDDKRGHAVSSSIKRCPPTPFDIKQLHQPAALSRQRPRVRVPSSPPFFPKYLR